MELPKNREDLLKNLEILIRQTFEAEKEFKELKNLLNGVIEFIPQALWVIDESGEIIFQNSKTADFESIPQEGEIETNGKHYLVQSSKIKNKTIISATDITRQKRNERLIAMGQMAAHLAHEIRNPIGSVSILLSILKKSCDQDEIINEMKSAILRIERIIKSTLLYSKGIEPNFKTVNLKEIFSNVQDSAKYYSHTKEITFLYEIPEVEIKADPSLLELVFQNMIFNAIDAIEECEKEKGIVKITYSQNEKWHIVTVTDDGKDFEDEKILFEPFKTTKTKGNGLGLALSREIIEAHKGKIKLAKREKGFEIYLPK
jgi:signal transduction histidine kinase